MTPDQITKIRQLLENTQVQVGATIEWAKYPGGAEEHGNKALNFLEEALTLFNEPFTIENAEVPEGFLLIKADSFLARLNKIAPCETCNGVGKKKVSGCFGMVHKEIPCPDCQPKPCETCEGLDQVLVPRKDTPGVDWEPCPDCT